MILLEKLKILSPLEKLPKNVGDLGKLIVATGFEKCQKCYKSPNLVTLVTKFLANSLLVNRWSKILTRSHCWTLNCKVELFLIENLKLRNVFCPFQKIFYSAFFPSDTFSYNPSISLSVSPLKYILSQSQFSILFTFSSSLSLSPSLFLSSLISYIFCNLLLLSLSFLLSVKVFLDNCRKQKSDVHVRLHI